MIKLIEKFLPYNLPLIEEDEINEVVDTLKSGWLTMGSKTLNLEKSLAEYLGVKNVVAVNSCTAGLHLSLIVKGIGRGDEVILPTYTFAATGNVVVHCGAKPVFVDVEENSFNIDPKKVREAITPKTKAIIVVHFGGMSANMDELMKICKEKNLILIEDAAHAIGTKYNGRKIGSFGNLTNYSFYATKNITTGEGGAIGTDDDLIANRLRVLRLHGISKDAWNRYGKDGLPLYEIEECGWKYNMTDIQAALGIHQLKKIDRFAKKRRDYAQIYNKELSKISGIKLPYLSDDPGNVYHLYPILLEKYDRNKFIAEMKKRNIGTGIHFIPLHMHSFYKKTFGYKEGDFPVSEKLYLQEVSLPLYPKMTEKEVHYVIEAVKEILQSDQ